MLFQNAKKINLKVSVSPSSDLWQRFHRFVGALGLHVQRGIASLSSRRPCSQFAGNPETKKGGISVWEKEIKRKCFRNKDC